MFDLTEIYRLVAHTVVADLCANDHVCWQHELLLSLHLINVETSVNEELFHLRSFVGEDADSLAAQLEQHVLNVEHLDELHQTF